MNKTIKMRITKLVKWLSNTFPEGNVVHATTGSVYFKISNKEVRLSDHIAPKESLQVVYNPLTDDILLVYTSKRFSYVGSIKEIKPIIYSMIVVGMHSIIQEIVSQPEVKTPVTATVTSVVNPERPLTFEMFKKFVYGLDKITNKVVANEIANYFFPGPGNKCNRQRIHRQDYTQVTEKKWNNLTKTQYNNIVMLYEHYSKSKLR